MPIQYGNSTHFSYLCHDIDPKGQYIRSGQRSIPREHNTKPYPNQENKNKTKI